jgi:hypothetical protein
VTFRWENGNWMRPQADWDLHRAIERSAYEGVLTGTQLLLDPR